MKESGVIIVIVAVIFWGASQVVLMVKGDHDKRMEKVEAFKEKVFDVHATTEKGEISKSFESVKIVDKSIYFIKFKHADGREGMIAGNYIYQER